LSQRYSGSTLLSFLLATHPAIATIGERRKFYTKSILEKDQVRSMCSCGKTFKNCEHWSVIKEALLSEIQFGAITDNPTEFQFSQQKALNHLTLNLLRFCLINKIPKTWWPFSKKLKANCRFNELLVQQVLKIEKKTVFLDSSKVIDHALFLSLIESFDLHIIWLSRDPRAQSHSALKYNPWSIEEAAHRWKKEMGINERILKKMDIPFLLLQYEALCRNPKKEMTRLLEFVGLDAEPFSLDFREKTQHIMGNTKMRLGKDRKIVERKDWLEQLSQEQIQKIETITADYRHYYAATD